MTAAGRNGGGKRKWVDAHSADRNEDGGEADRADEGRQHHRSSEHEVRERPRGEEVWLVLVYGVDQRSNAGRRPRRKAGFFIFGRLYYPR